MTWLAYTSGDTVTRRRFTLGPEDAHGNATKVAKDSVLPQTAAFDPGGSREPVEVGRSSVVTEPKLYFTERPDLTADDHVQVRSLWYSIEGDPADWRSPFGSDVGGLVVELKRVGG